MESPAIELGVDPSRQAEGAMLQGLVMQAAGELFAERMQDPESMRPMIATCARRSPTRPRSPPRCGRCWAR